MGPCRERSESGRDPSWWQAVLGLPLALLWSPLAYRALCSGILTPLEHFSALWSVHRPAASERSHQSLATQSGRMRSAEPCITRRRSQNQQLKSARPTGKSCYFSSAPLTTLFSASDLRDQFEGFLIFCHVSNPTPIRGKIPDHSEYVRRKSTSGRRSCASRMKTRACTMERFVGRKIKRTARARITSPRLRERYLR
jgi:hypothetical protein